MWLSPLWCGTNGQLPYGTGVLRCDAMVLPCGTGRVKWPCCVKPCGTRVVRWPTGCLPRGTKVGPTCQWLIPGWGPLADMAQWEAATWHTLSLLLFYSFCVSCTQFVPRVAIISNLYPELLWSNLSLWLIHLICLYFSWIYSDSSTYPKIMKISPKIPKFMMIIPVIFNSIFALASLN